MALLRFVCIAALFAQSAWAAEDDSLLLQTATDSEALPFHVPHAIGDALSGRFFLRTLNKGYKLAKDKLHETMQYPAASMPNCTETPALCQAPLNCDKNRVDYRETGRMLLRHVATLDGHSNLRPWCWDGARSFATTLVQHCIVNHDLMTSAKKTFELQKKAGIDLIDASYCFKEKHCLDTKVTVNTTVAEAEKFCDEKYGHDAWAKLNLISGKPKSKYFTKETGFQDSATPAFFGKMACAMGNYHCDIMYCKETYCKDEFYVKKFEHYL